jgi:aminoglycoside 6-adenylyltransferase
MHEREVIERLVAWGGELPTVRAMILTSSRARPGELVDSLSDYDVILAVTDADGFAREDAWQYEFGQPMVRWGDQDELYGLATYFRGVVYENGVKIDYTVWPHELLDQVGDHEALPDCLDVGYRVVLDKDVRTDRWNVPSFKAHIPAKPTEAEYQALIEEFWWDTTYLAKGLWRGELFFAKSFVLEHDIKLEAMRRLLEWRIEIDHDWRVKPGVFGRGLERWLPGDIWIDLLATYVGPDVEENWDVLFRTTALFRRVAIEVGDTLGYTYPQALDDQVSAYLNEVRKLPRGNESVTRDEPS